MPPGYHREWHVGVRVRSSGKLVAFISGVPIKLRVRDKFVMVLMFCFCVLSSPIGQGGTHERDQLFMCP
jgi:hypothetical protein